MNCPHCGYPNPSPVRFCMSCGKEIGSAGEIPAAPPVSLQPLYPNPQAYVRPLKDRSIAYILEILPGLFGILGIGWLYAGNTSAGIAWLVGVLIWDLMAIVIGLFSVGFGCFCTVPVNIVLIAVSTISLSNYVKAHPELFG
ncbi:MAG: zinc ribbon domain-containing protein [Chloroflexi bacterium]|nr:zinc ribbon domain-containing protein [Chloroflexota bacterium]